MGRRTSKAPLEPLGSRACAWLLQPSECRSASPRAFPLVSRKMRLPASLRQRPAGAPGTAVRTHWSRSPRLGDGCARRCIRVYAPHSLTRARLDVLKGCAHESAGACSLRRCCHHVCHIEFKILGPSASYHRLYVVTAGHAVVSRMPHARNQRISMRDGRLGLLPAARLLAAGSGLAVAGPAASWTAGYWPD